MKRTTNKLLRLTEPTKYVRSYVRKDRKSPEYYAELAKIGIVKRGPVRYRPNFRYTDPEICICHSCHDLENFRPKVTRERDCLDDYGNWIHDCDLLDLAPREDIIEVSEVDINGLYDKHKGHKKPCCSARKDLEELGIINREEGLAQ
jgi:hypothetical protein